MKYLLIVLSLAATIGCTNTNGPTRSFAMMAPPAIEVADNLYAVAEEKMPDTDFAERKLIVTGTIRFEVDNVETARAFIQDLVKEMDGYISSDDQQTYPTDIQIRQEIRVPASRLDDFITRLSSIAKNIREKDLQREDVTEEFIDNQSRLITKRELEKRYREILNHATKVSDMLQVEEQLAKVRGDIESMEGRVKYISNQAEFSSITVGYSQKLPVTDEFRFSTALISSLGNGWHNLELFLLEIVNQWPLFLIAIVAYILIYRWIKIKILSFRKLPVTA